MPARPGIPNCIATSIGALRTPGFYGILFGKNNQVALLYILHGQMCYQRRRSRKGDENRGKKPKRNKKGDRPIIRGRTEVSEKERRAMVPLIPIHHKRSGNLPIRQEGIEGSDYLFLFLAVTFYCYRHAYIRFTRAEDATHFPKGN